MSNLSRLYPYDNPIRKCTTLDGMWKMQFDPQSKGKEEKWTEGIPSPISIPVPAGFSDFFTDEERRDYCGDFWYEKEFFVQEKKADRNIILRFGSVTHRAIVYLNGKEVTRHEGGFLPFATDITEQVACGKPNKLVVWVNNELNETSLPCGSVKVLKNGKKIAKPYFDFFNYSGIQRSVWLLEVPKESIMDYSIRYEIDGENASAHYDVITNGTHDIKVILKDDKGEIVASANGKQGTLTVENARLWKVRDAYLYTIEIQIVDGIQIIDLYAERIGIRTVCIKGKQILVNNEPVYLKGYGKHEDFEIMGRGFNWSVLKRDFECMKWTEANCFRTSHYPYAEEWYQFADQEGFLIIDEVPAVGMMRSMMNFAAAGTGKYTYFFEGPNVPQLKEAHMRDVEEMIMRDKNHPSVIAWSLFNEPETTSDFARAYFEDIFSHARALDPESRPMTGALEKNSSPELCKCYSLCDFICLNRYYGWYISGGAEMQDAREAFEEEMDQWQEKVPNVPFVFTEFGADTLSSEHKLPGVMWTQEYQNKYLEMCFEIFDKYDFIQGELVWNFADFQTTEGILRVNGNKKGIFTRNRQPKDAAYLFKKRWSSSIQEKHNKMLGE